MKDKQSDRKHGNKVCSQEKMSQISHDFEKASGGKDDVPVPPPPPTSRPFVRERTNWIPVMEGDRRSWKCSRCGGLAYERVVSSSGEVWYPEDCDRLDKPEYECPTCNIIGYNHYWNKH
jgi:hypothetical protein